MRLAEIHMMNVVTLRIAVTTITAILVVMVGPSSTMGQMATELYIPLGRSPGVSNKSSFIGTIQAYDAGRRIVTLSGKADTITVSITQQTRIWLDRSKLKQSNLVGDTSALLAGRRTEVKFENADRKQIADWIKVEITRPE